MLDYLQRLVAVSSELDAAVIAAQLGFVILVIVLVEVSLPSKHVCLSYLIKV